MIYIRKVQNYILRGMVGGFVGGFTMACIPNNISIKFKEKQIDPFYIPFITGIIGSICTTYSPIFIINHIYNKNKLVDRTDIKYDINAKMYYQYGEKDKNGYPSLLEIEINEKKDVTKDL